MGNDRFDPTQLNDASDQERLQEALQRNAQWLDLFNGITDPIFIHDREFRVVQANRAYTERAGMALEAIIGRPYWQAFPRREGPMPDCEQALLGKRDHSEDEIHLPDGEVFRSRAFALYDTGRRHKVSVHILENITERLAMQRSLHESEEKFRLVTESVNDVFWLAAPDLSRFEYVSPAFERTWGIPRERLQREPQAFLESVHPDDRGAVQRLNHAGAAEASDLQYRILHPDGSVVWVHDRRFPVPRQGHQDDLIAGVATDITEQKSYEAQLQHQGTHDALTGLPNRSLLTDRLQQAIARGRRHEGAVAVLFIDLDRFKVINDSLGHGAGDHLLREMAGRLRSCMREDDTVARHGGDEFVVVMSEARHQADVIGAARRILEVVPRPVPWNGQELRVSASVGISLFPRDGEDAETLLRNADTAMYQAKETGRDNFKFFTAELNARVLERLTLEAQLRQALEREEFTLHYQPQVDLNTGYITGIEALVRWNHPQLGTVAPGQFIAIAEESGLIVPIGDWVLRTACRQMCQWRRLEAPPLAVAVNVSVRQLQERGFAAKVAETLRETGLTSSHIELELTESLLAERSGHLREELLQLKELGVLLALDDFGTGYSSLAYLQRYPFDSLKVDQSFVRDVTVNPENATISRTIVAMAHSLGLKVIAEGVETEAQAQYLRRNYCDQMQGFLYSRPLPAERMTELLLERRQLGLYESGATTEQRTLLIVDDERSVCRALERLLRKDGYRILTAQSAEEGFELLALHGAAVVLTDQRMPVMSGVEFLSRVRDIHPETLRLVLTGFPDVDTVTRAVNSGAVYKFLTKPWDEDELTEAVREAFRHYQRRSQSLWCG